MVDVSPTSLLLFSSFFFLLSFFSFFVCLLPFALWVPESLVKHSHFPRISNFASFCSYFSRVLPLSVQFLFHFLFLYKPLVAAHLPVCPILLHYPTGYQSQAQLFDIHHQHPAQPATCRLPTTHRPPSARVFIPTWTHDLPTTLSAPPDRFYSCIRISISDGDIAIWILPLCTFCPLTNLDLSNPSPAIAPAIGRSAFLFEYQVGPTEHWSKVPELETGRIVPGVTNRTNYDRETDRKRKKKKFVSLSHLISLFSGLL